VSVSRATVQCSCTTLLRAHRRDPVVLNSQTLSDGTARSSVNWFTVQSSCTTLLRAHRRDHLELTLSLSLSAVVIEPLEVFESTGLGAECCEILLVCRWPKAGHDRSESIKKCYFLGLWLEPSYSWTVHTLAIVY